MGSLVKASELKQGAFSVIGNTTTITTILIINVIITIVTAAFSELGLVLPMSEARVKQN